MDAGNSKTKQYHGQKEDVSRFHSFKIKQNPNWVRLGMVLEPIDQIIVFFGSFGLKIQNLSVVLQPLVGEQFGVEYGPGS